METLKNLIELKNYLDNNPKAPSSKWHKITGIRYTDIVILKENNMVKNKGNKVKPFWVWNAPMPNHSMANELKKRVLSYTRKINNKTPKEQKTTSFFSALEGIDIRISDYVSARVTSNGAVIKRGDFSINVEDPELFSNIIKLVK